MVSQLSIYEQEVAARSSFKYFLASQSQVVQAEDRMMSVKDMATRHLLAENGNVQRALERLKKTIEYRVNAKIDDIRICFDTSNDEYDQLASYREGLLPHLQSGKVFCRGHDRQNHTILTVLPRNEMTHSGWTEQWFTPSYCAYSLERAIACNELLDGSDGKVLVAFDYTGWQLRNAPPIPTTRQFLSILQSHYPEQIHAVYLVNTPRIFRIFWRLIKPFVKTPVTFVNGPTECQEAFEPIVDVRQAQPFMLPDAQLGTPIDIDCYLTQIPFNQAYT